MDTSLRVDWRLILRWVAVLPASVLAAALTDLIGSMLLAPYHALALPLSILFNRELAGPEPLHATIIAGCFATWVFIAVAEDRAPGHKVAVGRLLGGSLAAIYLACIVGGITVTHESTGLSLLEFIPGIAVAMATGIHHDPRD